LLTAAPAAYSQSSPERIVGVQEPPELKGPPKRVDKRAKEPAEAQTHPTDWEKRAQAHYRLKQYRLAIGDYSRVLELDPENVTAYEYRGSAEMQLKQYSFAARDFGQALQRRGDDWWDYGWAITVLESRGDADVEIGMYKDAVLDYSKAIEKTLAVFTSSWSLKQFRRLYPEYNEISDEVLCRKLHALFWPEEDYAELKRKLLEENKNEQIGGQLNFLYNGRAKAYLGTGDYRRAALDYQRLPTGLDLGWRWHALKSGSGREEQYIDLRTFEVTDVNTVRFWLKTWQVSDAFTVQSYESDCTSKRINVISTVVYNSKGDVVNSFDTGAGWQQIVPESRGEELYAGMCSAGQ
jgi:hypothetical protein